MKFPFEVTQFKEKNFPFRFRPKVLKAWDVKIEALAINTFEIMSL